MLFNELADYLDTLQSVGVPGCDLVVYKDHQMIFRHMAGYRDADRREPMQGNEAYWLYSCTKVHTTCAAMQLIENGTLHLDDPVSKYLPAYAHLTVDGHPARNTMTIRHLMSMQSGLDYNLEKPVIKKTVQETAGKATTRQIVDAIAQEPLCFEPGTNFMYSLSHDVLAAVIEVASGERFSDYLHRHIWDPLHLDSFSFHLTEPLKNRLCAAYMMVDGKQVLCPADGNNYRLSENYESGGAGLVGDADDYILFLDALACEGKSADGTTILDPEMIQLWSANQLEMTSRKAFDAWKRLGYSYALGVRTRVDTSIGGEGQIGEFGWDGAAGAWAMVDPVNHLSAYFAMHVRNFGYSYDVIHPTIRSLIYKGLRH